MKTFLIAVWAGLAGTAAIAETHEAPVFDANTDTNIAAYMAVVDEMPGITFEKLVAQLLVKQGYSVSNMRASNDYGVDIIATRMADDAGNQVSGEAARKREERTAIQVKRSKNKIARKAISDAVAGMAYYKCKRAMVVTNSEFTEDAREFARGTECVLVDRKVLIEWITGR
jgi:restriction system protein